MDLRTAPPRTRRERVGARPVPSAAGSGPAPTRPPSSLERVGLVAFAFWVPLDSRISILGTGLGTLLLIGMIGALLLSRAGALGRVARQATVGPLYLMVGFALAIEVFHPASSFSWWSRVVQVVIGVVVVAAVARDARTVRAAALGIVLGGVCIAGLLTFSSWSTFSGIDQLDGRASHQGRAEALDGTILGPGSINTAAIFTAAAGAVAIAMALTAPTRVVRLAYGAAAAVCFVGAAFSVSRGALLSGVIAALVAVLSQRQKVGRRAVTAIVVALALFLVLPASVFGRVVDTEVETPGGKRDSRVVLWEAVGATLDQTLVLGVGEGRYFGGWAAQNDFTSVGTRVAGTHSSLTQMLVFWGIVPVAFFVAFVVSLFTKLGTGRAPPEARLPVLVFLVAVTVELVLSHSLHGKQYVLGFGLALALVTWRPRRVS